MRSTPTLLLLETPGAILRAVTARHVQWLVLLLFVACAWPAAAQAPDRPAAPQSAPAASLVELRLTDGSVLYGTIESETPERLVIRTIAGVTITVQRAQVLAMAPARGRVVDGEFRPSDSNATRLLFAPTGRSLRRGQGYIGVYEFLLPFVQVGVTDELSLGVGTPLIFFGDESGRPVWVTPKYQFYRDERTSAAVGVMHFVMLGENVRAGLAYGVATFGTDDSALTAGLGWAYARYRDTEYPAGCPGPSRPPASCTSERVTKTPGSAVIMIGGEGRINRRLKMITENYVFKEGGILSAGIRFMGDRLSADLGLFVPLSSEEFFAAPIVNFVWTFGG